MKIFTIGFTRTSAEHFFGRLQDAGVAGLVDVRLKTGSQLSGFAKKQDLAFFTSRILSIPYRHELLLAPTDSALADYRARRLGWQDYANVYLDTLADRQVDRQLTPEALDGMCLLCSEDKPHFCHRRLAAEFLRDRWGRQVEIVHL